MSVEDLIIVDEPQDSFRKICEKVVPYSFGEGVEDPQAYVRDVFAGFAPSNATHGVRIGKARINRGAGEGLGIPLTYHQNVAFYQDMGDSS